MSWEETARLDLVEAGLILQVATQRGKGAGGSTQRYVSLRQGKPGAKRRKKTDPPKQKAP